MNNVIPMSTRIRPGGSTGAPAELLAQVRALNLELEQWRLYGLESESAEHVAAHVMPVGARLLSRAHELFASLEDDAAEGLAAETRPGDIAYFALLEITKLQSTLSNASPELPPWRRVELCELIRGQLMNACSALQRVLSEEPEAELDEVQEREVARALRVRSRLAAFRAGLAAGARTAIDDPTRRMRLAGTALAMLVGSTEYQDFRLSDRMLVRAIQRDILAWMSSAQRDAREAQRVWEDLMGFVELSRQVNRHVSLSRHDEGALARLATSLAGRPAYDPLPSPLEPLVRALWGLHPRLDALIESTKPRTCAAWRDCIRDIRGEQARPSVADPLALPSARPA